MHISLHPHHLETEADKKLVQSHTNCENIKVTPFFSKKRKEKKKGKILVTIR